MTKTWFVDGQIIEQKIPEDYSTTFKLEEAMKEIDRLKQQIRYQDQRDGRIGTHSPTCYSFGPHHYECALRKILDLESER